VETIGALIACSAALAIGLVLGYRWRLGSPWHLFAGFVAGEICAAVYFAVANWVGRSSPDLLDPWLVGVNFMVLVIAAAPIGVFGAWFGYRKSLGRSLF
jgi:hypothetical protein